MYVEIRFRFLYYFDIENIDISVFIPYKCRNSHFRQKHIPLICISVFYIPWFNKSFSHLYTFYSILFCLYILLQTASHNYRPVEII